MPAGPAEAETWLAGLCLRLLRGSLQRSDAALGSALQGMQEYAAQRVHATQLALAT